MKIYDFFLFNHEIDLLALRIDYCKDTIAHFYAFESDIAFSGEPKKLYSDDFIAKYPELSNYVTFVKLDLSGKNITWEREHCARMGYLKFALENHADCIGIFGDMDEFVNPDFFKIADFLSCPTFRLDMICLMYNSKFKCDFHISTVLASVINNDFCQIDKRGVNNIFPIIDGYAYHFQNFFSPEDISIKIKSNSHNEFYDDVFTNVEDIKNRVKNKLDYLGRDGFDYFENTDFNDYPEKLKQLFKTKYKQFN